MAAVTTAIAIYGAVASTASLAFVARKEFLDRPQIVVRTAITAYPDGRDPELIVHVDNIGRRSVGIREIGVEDRDGNGAVLGEALPGTVRTIPPDGGSIESRWSIAPTEPEIEVRAYARDTRSKLHFEADFYPHVRRARQLQRGEHPT